MTLKTSVNLATLAVLGCTILFMYFTWSSKHWIDSVNGAIAVADSRYDDADTRITKLETENTFHWAEAERRLKGIEDKLTSFLDNRGRR